MHSLLKGLLVAAVLTPLALACSGNKAAPLGSPLVDDRPLNTPSAGTPAAQRQITGLFAEPKPAKVSSIKLPAKPESSFQPYDRKSVVLYDTQTGKETNLGPGIVNAPAFGGGKMVFISNNEALLVDLTSLSKTSLGPANRVAFVNDGVVLIGDAQTRTFLLDLKSGQRILASTLSEAPIGNQETNLLGGPLRRRLIEGGDTVGYATDVAKVYSLTCLPTPEPASRLCGARFLEEFAVEDQEGRLLFQFRALQALPAGPNEIVVATSPRCDDGGKQVWCEDVLAKMETQDPSGPIKYAKGTTNIFLVDLVSGKAKFVATARYDPPTKIRPFNWPLSADANYVTWTESYCGKPAGKTRIYDRKYGEIRELDGSMWVRLAAGFMGDGEFGPKALIDPLTLRYKAVLPSNLSDVYWSPDFRYAVATPPVGHGGLCG